MVADLLCRTVLVCAFVAAPGIVLADDDPVGGGAGDAVSAFVACYEAEGNVVTDDDRAGIEALGAGLTALVSDLELCEDAGGACEATGGGLADLSHLAELPCEAWAEQLAQAAAALEVPVPDGLTEELLGDAATPPGWALGYGHALGSLVERCYAAEGDGAVVDEEARERIAALEGAVARAVGALGSTRGCEIPAVELERCTSELATRSCEATLEGLYGLLEPAAPEPELIDVDAVSDEELDAWLEASAVAGQARLEAVLGSCATALRCAPPEGEAP